jgi:ElaB/YqjD/DUF883 family membrane-anchored ribosome-binding protein
MAQESSDVGRKDTFELADNTLDNPGRGYVETRDNEYHTDLRDMAADTGDQTEDTEQIKGQIEETRREMGQTIDAIQEKLSFSNISDQVSEHVNNAVETAKGAVYEATIGKAVHFMKNVGDGLSSSSIVRTAKNNPYPFILMGLGAGLLAYQSYSGGGRRSKYGRSQRYEFRTGGEGTYDRGQGQNQAGILSTAREGLSGVTDTVSSAAGNAYNSLTETAGNVYSSTGDVMNRAYDKFGEFGSTAREQYDHYLEENPLALAGVALALGAAVGMAIPSTQYEGELMGDARERIMDKAQSSATQLLDKTKQAVNEASRSVSEQARSLAE